MRLARAFYPPANPAALALRTCSQALDRPDHQAIANQTTSTAGRVFARGANQAFNTSLNSLRTCEQVSDEASRELLSGTSALIFRNCGRLDHTSIRRRSVSRVKINISHPTCFPPSNDLQAGRFNRLILLRYSQGKPLCADHRVANRARRNANAWRDPLEGVGQKTRGVCRVARKIARSAYMRPPCNFSRPRLPNPSVSFRVAVYRP